MESIKYGRAVISTSIGAEGLRFENGTEIMIADTPSDFIVALTKLITDKPFADRLVARSTKKLDNLYTQEALDRIYYEMIDC